jgi:hypothetical protein
MQRDIIAINIEQLRRRALFWFANSYFLRRQQVADFAARIIHITGDNGLFGADNDAGRLQADVSTVGTVVAFSRRSRIRIDINSIIWTGLQASFTADASAIVKLDNAIVALVHSLSRADTHTGRIGTVVAARHLKVTAGVRVHTLLYIFDPGTIDTKRHFIFAFTSSRTGVAANAFAVVNDKTIIFGSNSEGKISGHPCFLR